MITLDDGYLAFGSCVAGLGFLVASLLALLFRHPRAPRWTRPEIVTLLTCVPVTAAIGVGLGYVVYGLYRLAHGEGDPRGLLVLAAVVVVLALAWRVARIRQRLQDYAVATGSDVRRELATQPTLATSEERPAPRPPEGLPGRLA